jgi:hypothetical protein
LLRPFVRTRVTQMTKLAGLPHDPRCTTPVASAVELPHRFGDDHWHSG